MGTKRKLESEDAAAPAPAPKRATRTCTTNDTQKNPTTTANNYPANTAVKRASAPPSSSPDMQPQLDRIAASAHQTTPFQKRVLRLLCQVPRGRVTTYGLLSAHLRASPRAVGSALRRNPFAPQVPCHRVVAAGGALGGFKGQWRSKAGAGAEDAEDVAARGRALEEKRTLLRGEGVKFYGATGRVVGTPFGAFV